MKPDAKPRNMALVRARLSRGWASQEEFAEAFERTALECGLRIGVSSRQVRRWESKPPPWPTPVYQRVLRAMFEIPLDELGFVEPYDRRGSMEDPSATKAIRGLRETEQPGWWRTDPSEGSHERVERLLEVEQLALVTRTYESSLIPGPLQVYEYAVAAIRAHLP